MPWEIKGVQDTVHQQSITYGPISSRKRQYHKIDTTTLPPPFTQTCKARVHCQQYVHLNTVLCSLPQMATCNTMVLCPKKTIAMPTIAMRALKTVLANCGVRCISKLSIWSVHSLTITISAPTGPCDLTIILVLRKTSINHDGEMITEIQRESIKEGMK